MQPRHREILSGAVEVLGKRLGPRRIFLFGSRARGGNDERADFDLAIEGARPDRATERLIQEEIEAVAGLYHVDVVFLDDVDEDFRVLVTRTGKVIHDGRDG